ncbi:MAG: thiopeptide-type bacteriocin biosynthesis protein [Micromonosporaceae bacterium]|nr:thiopeptide-type bacteriocin biosynthesis protein [Micromonosporaceae bacterium]
MSADRLTSADAATTLVGHPQPAHQPTTADDKVNALEQAVWAMLAGNAETETCPGVSQVGLLEAVERYRAAGRAALRWQVDDRTWAQINLGFADPATAERIMIDHLWPWLRAATAVGTLTSWWYIRKTPWWRLRLQTAASQHAAMHQSIAPILDQLLTQDRITTWSTGVYEPEIHAFGGPEGMAVAHQFFHADSSAILDYLDTGGTPGSQPARLGRREMSMVLCTALLRAAGQDWHEQGDVWQRVTRMRPLPADVANQAHRTVPAVYRLLTLDTGPSSPLRHDHGPLADAAAWLDAAAQTGQALKTTAAAGTLRRGLRAVLAHHVIFHWNRLGLDATTQALLAHTAAEAVFTAADGEPAGCEPGNDVART